LFIIPLLTLAAVCAANAQRQPTRSPHEALNIPCENCHTSASWSPIRAIPEFNHDTTRYPLRGLHEKVSCTGCHLKPVFRNVGKNCSDCHADIHRAQFGANCAQCHTVLGWQVSVQAIQNHFNRFPLLGAHAVVECNQCHKNAAVGNYLGLSTACESCHMTDYQSTTTPVHSQAGPAFAASNCANCHSFDNWSSAKFNGQNFNHSAFGFALTGTHMSPSPTPCAACHINNNYNLTSNDCYGCHQAAFLSTVSMGGSVPNHVAAGFPITASACASCHPITTWSAGTFNHSAFGFPLMNGHANVACNLCHINNNYSLNSTACYPCHVAQWQSTTQLGGTVPNHITSGFPTGCSNCHSTVNWTSATFNHNNTPFPLTGAHVSVACNLCHTSSAPPPTDCYSCHIAKWQSTATLGGLVPNHIALGYPTTCQSCHTTTSWLGAVFDHNTTGFPLTGAHISVACNLCHTSSAIPPTDCYSCHTARWQSTASIGGTVPNHLAADASIIGIVPSACSTCHTTTNWLGATFTHNFWNVNHGSANGVCAACHTSSTTYTAFACSNGACHPKSSVDNIHQGNSSYVYSTGVTCYACHHP
jgi:hypothetical protein